MGGVSKASKGIHLSEDIFAGFNYVLRGGEATQADYIQVWYGVMALHPSAASRNFFGHFESLD